MATKHTFKAGQTEKTLTLFDLSDDVSMSLFNENYKILTDGIEQASNASDKAFALLNEMVPKFTDMKTQMTANNTIVSNFAKRMTTAETSLKAKTSAITTRPKNATALAKGVAQIVSCDYTRWISGSLLKQVSGGIQITGDLKKVIITGQVYFTGTAGDAISAYICKGSASVAMASSRVPVVDVDIVATTKTLNIATGVTKTTKTVDGAKVLTDIALKTTEQKVITAVKKELKSGGIAIAIPTTVVSCTKGDIFYLKAKNSSGSGSVPGGTDDDADVRSYLTVIGIE